MAFINQGLPGAMGSLNMAGTGKFATLDTGQIDKIKEAGFTMTPVATSAQTLEMGTPTTKQILPGVAIPAYVDGRGNTFTVGENQTVYQVEYKGPQVLYQGPNLGNDYLIPPPDVPPVLPGPPINGGGGNFGGGGGGGFSDPVSPSPVPPNFGSGKIFTRFDMGDVVPNQQETVTRALWSGNVGNLTTMYTGSSLTTTQKRYYYDIYNSSSGACGSEVQYSIAYGHKNGSGSADEGGQINDTPSRAIYGQYRLLLMEGDTPRFTIGGSTTDHIYVINVARSRMREWVDEGNIEINLAHLSGSKFMQGGGNLNAHTGSNVRLLGNNAVLRLIDDSTINSATITELGEVYDIVSGSLEDGVYNSSAPHVYGQLYRRQGVVVLNANTLDISASFGTVTGSEVAGDNAYKLFLAMSGAALLTDASGDYLGFQGRSAENVKSTHYFCRVKNGDYNFTNNPTYVTGSEGDLAEPTFINDPKTYITTVGLYNERKELLAVAKSSRAIKKTFTSEVLLKVKLEF